LVIPVSAVRKYGRREEAAGPGAPEAWQLSGKSGPFAAGGWHNPLLIKIETFAKKKVGRATLQDDALLLVQLLAMH
jgi:hypothetical protein